MSTDAYLVLALTVGLCIIAGLAFYAGRLLFLLAKQRQQAQRNRQTRIDNIIESIQIIAKATEQQQCNLSEASIRIIGLFRSLPLEHPPVYADQFPRLFELYEQVKHLPTHQERKALSHKVRESQDEKREEVESKLESAILKEMTLLKTFCVEV